MAYIRWGEDLPSGSKSTSYVFGESSGLFNMNEGTLIKYSTIRELFKTRTDLDFKDELGKMLELKGEELEVVCLRLFDERNKGDWDKPFDFET